MCEEIIKFITKIYDVHILIMEEVMKEIDDILP